MRGTAYRIGHDIPGQARYYLITMTSPTEPIRRWTPEKAKASRYSLEAARVVADFVEKRIRRYDAPGTIVIEASGGELIHRHRI